MERLKNLMNEKGYNRYAQEYLEELFECIEPQQFEKTISAFMEFVKISNDLHEVYSKCWSYLSELHNGMWVRTRILEIFLDRDYPVQKTNRVFRVFGQIPFEEKENFAKRILPIVEETEDIDLIIKRTKENIKEFKKEIENQGAR